MVHIIDKTYRQIICYNEKIGHLYVPNINARIINEKGGYYVRTNSLGFRSQTEFKKEKTHKPRILFFGDSVTAGDGASNNERFSELLGESLGAEVYNFGLSGSGTDQQCLILENYAKNIEADLIIFGVSVENIERNKVAYREAINPFTKKSVLISKPYFSFEDNVLNLRNSPPDRKNSDFNSIDPELVQWAIPKNRKNIYKAVEFWRNNKLTKFMDKNFEPLFERIRSIIIKTAYQPYKEYENPNGNGYIIMREIIKRFIDSSNSKPIIILPIPTYQYIVDGAKPIFKNFFNSLENKKKNIYVLDLLAELIRLNFSKRKSLFFKQDKSHFSQAGHKLVSSFLTSKVKKLNIIIKDKEIKKLKTKRKKIKNKHKYILGISAFYHDSAAALIKDGEIIAAAQEERFSRQKNDRRFPVSAINYCLEKANIHQEDLAGIAYYDNTYLTLERMLWSFAKTVPNSEKAWCHAMPSWVKYKLFIPKLIREKLKYNGKIFQNLHHRSHLASAFFASPYKKAAILTVDGVGEWATASIGIGNGNKIKMLKEMNFPDSIGLLYSAFTQFTGFKVNSGEYKMMGLAPYGKPIYTNIILKEIVRLNKDGSIKINQKYFSYLNGSVMTNKKFANLFGGPGRTQESKITKREMDIACSIQKVTEKIILTMAKYVKKITKADYLCMSGGVALNCVANGYLDRKKIFKEIWVQPASGDAGSSIGCALDVYYNYFGKIRKLRKDKRPLQLGSCWGPEWNNDEIKSFLDTDNIKYTIFKNKKEKYSLVSKCLEDAKVVGYFSGRGEFGPRALGSRSILADPRNKDMQTVINLKIKRRESFRPFAPAILASKANQFFKLNKKSPYMMFVSPVVKKRRLPFNIGDEEDMLKIVKQSRSDVPAVTHIDYSARVQTVDESDNKDFYNLIETFNNLTGCPLLINTSFNIRGEPIVNTPMEAYRCFINTDMDVLVLENFIIFKENQDIFDKNKWAYSNFTNYESKEKGNYLKRKVKNLYKKDFIALSNKFYSNFLVREKERSTWIDVKNYVNSKKVFNISVELDSKNHNSKRMAKKIIQYWSNKNLKKIFEPIIFKLICLSEKHPISDDTDSKVSDKMYEMF